METDQELEVLLDKYRDLEEIVDERLHRILDSDGGRLIHVMHRVKTVDSIREKIERKQGKYQSAAELTDLLGFRIICYFSRDVDRIADLVADNFRVDWNRSKDKRKLIDARAFGYLSLHYICSLPEEDGELSDLPFEIQMKTMLQHSWAEVEHDLGYKSEIEVPREIRRSFSKAASLLETADDIFTDIAAKLEQYRSRVSDGVENENLDELFFDRHTIKAYTEHNRDYRNLLDEIAAITDAHITEGAAETQLPLIEYLDIRTLSEMSGLIRDNHDLIMKLAHRALDDSELDELISTVAYYYLFRAILISGDYGRDQIRGFFALTTDKESVIENNTDRILKDREAV